MKCIHDGCPHTARRRAVYVQGNSQHDHGHEEQRLPGGWAWLVAIQAAACPDHAAEEQRRVDAEQGAWEAAYTAERAAAERERAERERAWVKAHPRPKR